MDEDLPLKSLFYSSEDPKELNKDSHTRYQAVDEGQQYRKNIYQGESIYSKCSKAPSRGNSR